MTTSRSRHCAGRSDCAAAAVGVALLGAATLAAAEPAEVFNQRGFVEGRVTGFARATAHDDARAVVDLLAREELFITPARAWQLAAGVDLRADSHDETDRRWALDWQDRGARRPTLSLRRLSVNWTAGDFSVEAGKQFIRWGAVDIVNPTDRFAPRDYLNVTDNDFLAVTGVRAVARRGSDSVELVWTPEPTPSRVPLPNQRWSTLPDQVQGLPVVVGATVVPSGPQTGLRWRHVGEGLEGSLSYFDGYDHVPQLKTTPRLVSPAPNVPPVPAAIEIAPDFQRLRTVGADIVWPADWATVKGEAAYFGSRDPNTAPYVQYVLQLERQSGDWTFMGGYVGDTASAAPASGGTPQPAFSPDRGISRSFLARAALTIDATRNFTFEGALRHNAHGAYAKFEYSQGWGEHWRGTVSAVALGGRSDDFFGQYRRNSHLSLALRYSH